MTVNNIEFGAIELKVLINFTPTYIRETDKQRDKASIILYKFVICCIYLK